MPDTLTAEQRARVERGEFAMHAVFQRAFAAGSSVSVTPSEVTALSDMQLTYKAAYDALTAEIEALRQERDEVVGFKDAWFAKCNRQRERAEQAEAERDATLEEVARLREILSRVDSRLAASSCCFLCGKRHATADHGTPDAPRAGKEADHA